MKLKKYQKDFINFLVTAEVLTFGNFVTKSGRETPYFVNAGKLNTGSIINEAGKWYATHLVQCGFEENLSTVFGPAYKGIPLSVATASQLNNLFSVDVGFTFDRKEEKQHGDRGKFVGRPLNPGDSIVIVEDVITAGTTLKEMLPLLINEQQLSVKGVIVAVDRRERGTGEKSALDEIQDEFGVPIKPIVSIYDVRDFLAEENPGGKVLTENEKSSLDDYLQRYGVRC